MDACQWSIGDKLNGSNQQTLAICSLGEKGAHGSWASRIHSGLGPMALTAGPDPTDLDGPTSYFGYPVSTGCGALADAVAIHAVRTWGRHRLEDIYIPARPVPSRRS